MTHAEKQAKKALHEHLDHIAVLRSREALALELGIEDTALGAQEDIRRRLNEVARLRRELEDIRRRLNEVARLRRELGW